MQSFSLFLDRLKNLWVECNYDRDMWMRVSVKDMNLLAGKKDTEPRLLSSRVLYGLDSHKSEGDRVVSSKFELPLGMLDVVAPGIILFRSFFELYDIYNGLVKRDDGKFTIESAIDISARVEFVAESDGNCIVVHSSSDGISYLRVQAYRWQELESWLVRWMWMPVFTTSTT